MEDLVKIYGFVLVVLFFWKLIFFIILVIGCIGNILMIFLIFSDKYLKIFIYFLIVCMVIVDLCVIVV